MEISGNFKLNICNGRKRLVVLIVCILAIRTISFSQSADSIVETKSRNAIWFTPSKADVINGVAIGPFTSQLFFGERKQIINGLAVEFVGIGIGVLLMPGEPYKEYFSGKWAADSTHLQKLNDDIEQYQYTSIHNGLFLSALGSGSDKINGVSISGFASGGASINGLCINPFCNMILSSKGVTMGAINYSGRTKGVQVGFTNSAVEMKGLQIGMFNGAAKMKGLQIGLWNHNGKRGLPIINWSK